MTTLFIESKDKTLIEILVHNKNKEKEAPAIIIAHPYGPLGGNMNNNVVMAIQHHFESKGYVTICLNFRGCGQSKGKTSWTGIPERNDYLSVIDFIQSDQYPQGLPRVNHLTLCGYSFGALIANSIQCQLPCDYILVSLPLGVIWALVTTKSNYFKQHNHHRTLCIYGNHDQFTGAQRIKQWCQTDHHLIDDVSINGVDHFWVNNEHLLIKHIEHWRLKTISHGSFTFQ